MEVVGRLAGGADVRGAMTVLQGRLWAAGCISATEAAEERVRCARRRPCRCWTRREMKVLESGSGLSDVLSNYHRRLPRSVARGFNRVDGVPKG